MSKGKVYKKKSKLGGNIFVILGVVLAALIVFTVIFTAWDNSKYNKLLEDYTEFEYGERQDVKLKRGVDPSTGIVVYANEEYAYYVDDNIICDLAKIDAAKEGFTSKVAELSADFGEISTMDYMTYTDSADFSKKYDFVQIAATYDGVLGSTDAAAEKIAALIDALNEEYNICGLYLNYSDGENIYYTTVDLTERQLVTLEKIKENMASLPLTIEAEVNDGEAEAETAEDETAE